MSHTCWRSFCCELSGYFAILKIFYWTKSIFPWFISDFEDFPQSADNIPKNSSDQKKTLNFPLTEAELSTIFNRCGEHFPSYKKYQCKQYYLTFRCMWIVQFSRNGIKEKLNENINNNIKTPITSRLLNICLDRKKQSCVRARACVINQKWLGYILLNYMFSLSLSISLCFVCSPL